MLELIIVILVVLWLLGFLGPIRIPRMRKRGNAVHILLVIALVLLIVRLL